jgi:hypothetical protein
VAGASALLVACGSASSAAKLDSGIAGKVLLGPTCPVQRVGQTCETAYRTTIEVLTARRHRLVKKVRSGSDGRFRVQLAPGRYTLTGAHSGLPRATPVTVTVRAHRYAHVTIRFDTGIR